MSEAFDVDAPTLSRYVMQNTKDHERKILKTVRTVVLLSCAFFTNEQSHHLSSQ